MLSNLILEVALPAMVKYTAADEVDVILVYIPKDMFEEDKPDCHTPVAVIPWSDRAKSLFAGWGWKQEKSMGIRPPEDAMDLINSMPMDFVLSKSDIQEGVHIIHEIALPQALPVLH